jgi:hypothetical protein
MLTVNAATSARTTGRAVARALDGNPCEPHRMEATRTRDNEIVKTNPFAPGLPDAAARCAFERSGAQRFRTRILV